MIVNLTKQEKAQLKDVEKKYNKLIKKYDFKLLEKECPEREQYEKKRLSLIQELNTTYSRLFNQFEKRQFSELGSDPDKIIADAKHQIEEAIKNRYNKAIKDKKKGKVFSQHDVRVDREYLNINGRKRIRESLYIDPEAIIKDSENILKLHYDFFKNDPETTKVIQDAVIDAVSESPYTGTAGELGDLINKEKQTYITRAKAQEAGAITDAPKSLAVPTLSGYQNSVSLYQSGGAYLQPISSTDALKFKNGKMYFENKGMKEVSEVELQNMKTKEGIDDIDLPMLRIFYSIILTQFEITGCKELQDVLTMSVSALAEFMGLKPNLNKKDIARVIDKAQSYHNVIGVLHGTRNGKPVQSLYPVLNFEGYNDKNKTIRFSSPYMNYVIQTVYNLATRKTKNGEIKAKKNGEPLRIASHSYLIDSSIAKERNKAAVENVVIIVTLIEQAGNGTPQISAKTLIDRNVQLSERLNNSTNKTQLLNRTFSKTWQLLRDNTRLKEFYKNIKLPDPTDPAFIPTIKMLDSMVFKFPHDGKNKSDTENQK